MTSPLQSWAAVEGVWLFPVAIAIHFAEEAPRFAQWARRNISALYTDAHWRKVHALGLVLAVAWCAFVSLWPHPISIFLFWALCLSPMLFNAVFHVAASVVYRSYSPGAVSAFVLFPALACRLASSLSNTGLLGTETAIVATVIGAIVHALDLASTTFFVQQRSFFTDHVGKRNKTPASGHFRGEARCTQERL